VRYSKRVPVRSCLELCACSIRQDSKALNVQGTCTHMHLTHFAVVTTAAAIAISILHSTRCCDQLADTASASQGH
jgi:hypothetical protein